MGADTRMKEKEYEYPLWFKPFDLIISFVDDHEYVCALVAITLLMWGFMWVGTIAILAMHGAYIK